MAKANSSALLTLKTILFITTVLGFVFYLVWNHLPNQDSVTYFQFADQRRILGVPHFWDSFSNVLFLHIGLFGIFIFIKNYHQYDQALWENFLVLNLAVLLTSLGSAYFHLDPSPQKLIWDRWPMAMGFASLVCFIFADRVTDKYHRWFLPVMLVLASVTVWNIDYGNKDLRPYLALQFGSLLASLLLVVLFRRGRISNRAIYLGLLFYIMAKFFEFFDQFIFEYFIWSGHTVKHFFAAAAILTINVGASFAHLKIKR